MRHRFTELPGSRLGIGALEGVRLIAFLTLVTYFMADRVTKATRSRMMASVRSKDTKPEVLVRRGLFALGFRYSLHRRDLAGTPDIVFPKYSAVIFVHGCFWHRHGCERSKLPKTRREWWKEKLEGNKKRDERAVKELLDNGWRVLTIWECVLKGRPRNNASIRASVLEDAQSFLLSTRSRFELQQPSHGIGV